MLLIAGAGGDAAGLAGLAATFADAFTVTICDRRGNSHSPALRLEHQRALRR